MIENHVWKHGGSDVPEALSKDVGAQETGLLLVLGAIQRLRK